jgi:2-amino-4-hydroxy-6-hydroxymethyldihydropteridine diphosphokinase
MVQGNVRGKTDTVTLRNCDICLVALGSNLEFGGGGSAYILEYAFEQLKVQGFVIRARSRFFRTPAYPAGAGPDFVNAAAVLQTPFDAPQTLARLHAVEAALGRTRTVRWGARTLDLDLLAMGDLVLPDAQTHCYWREMPLEQQKTATPEVLILPHPRLAERAFVLVPLLDVAADWVHPVTGKTVRQMHDALPEPGRQEVVAL